MDFRGEVINLDQGRLNFTPRRSVVPVYVASNGPLGQRVAGVVADGAIMEACASVEEAQAFSDAITTSASQAGRDPKSVEKIARLNTCVAENGHAARAVVRPLVARYLGAGRLQSRTLEAQGLALPAEALEAVAGVPYPAGVAPYLPLLPLITDRHIDALTLAGTIEEVADHVVAIVRAGIDGVIIRPFAPEGGTIEDTIVTFGSKVWPRVLNSIG